MAAPAVDFSGLCPNIKSYTLREAETLLTTILITDQSFLNFMELYPDVTDQLALTQMFVSSVLQPGGKDTFNPKGTVGFKNRIGQVCDCKIDYTLTPTMINAMWKSYLGRIAKSKRGDVYDVPFQQYIIDKLAEKAKEEMHLEAVFKGVYNHDKTAANRVFDGLLPLLSKAAPTRSSSRSTAATWTSWPTSRPRPTWPLPSTCGSTMPRSMPALRSSPPKLLSKQNSPSRTWRLVLQLSCRPFEISQLRVYPVLLFYS